MVEAPVCKTGLSGFESRRYLHSFAHLGAVSQSCLFVPEVDLQFGCASELNHDADDSILDFGVVQVHT